MFSVITVGKQVNPSALSSSVAGLASYKLALNES